MKKTLFSFILTVLSICSFAQNTVVDIIVNSTEHDTLEAAIIAAELADDLSGPGPFTVFAPTDAAFAALPSGTIETLLSDPTGTLAQILLYHVVGGQALSTDLSNGQTIATLQGQTVEVTINADGVFINDAQVIVADITATNGVVHVIDAVLLPPAPQPTTTVVDVIVNSDVHNTLETAVIAAGLVETLSGTGPFTVFAPTDAAFAALPAGTVETLLADPTGTLTQILLYHVVGAQALSTDLTNGQTVATLQGQTVTVTINTDGVFINNAQVTVADIVTDNGVIHVIDAVLLPQQPSFVSNAETIGSVDVYPNPANDILNVSTSNQGVIEIYSSEGKLISTTSYSGPNTVVNVEELSRGNYIAVVRNNNGTVQLSKFTKNI
jgi:uncharacterized surface protein with fasciclin (FAS1) repeats